MFCNFAGDSTLCSFNKNLSDIFQSLERDLKKLLN